MIPDKCFALSGTVDGNIAGGVSGTTDGGIPPRCLDDPLSVIPGLFRDLFEKAGIAKQPSSRHPGLVPGPI